MEVLSKQNVALPVMHSLSWSGSCSAGLRGTFGGSASRARRRQADRPTTTLPCCSPSRPHREPAPRRPIADSGRITALACSAHRGLHVGQSSRRDLAPGWGTRMPDRYPSVAITGAGSRGIGWPARVRRPGDGVGTRFTRVRGAALSERNTLVRSLHDLGLAAWFGGSLMGAVGLNGAAEREGGNLRT